MWGSLVYINRGQPQMSEKIIDNAWLCNQPLCFMGLAKKWLFKSILHVYVSSPYHQLMRSRRITMDRIYGRGAGERGQDGSMARRLDVHLRRTISSTKTQKEEVPIPPGCWNSFMRIDTIKISGPVSWGLKGWGPRWVKKSLWLRGRLNFSFVKP